ncbi:MULTISPECIES: DUF4229 domain-containing protein [unclassified Streptomyces]|uniref:DUF4229 domain-containing protein n=2 Tax=unclassified Streptomyces TaxID=2593676 RepID=UPI0033C4EF54
MLHWTGTPTYDHDEREGVTVSLKTSATIRYTAMRLGIFVGCLVVVAVLVRLGWVPAGLGDANLAWVALLALVISAPLSFVLLRKQRDEMSAQISGRVEGAKQKLAANRSQEDQADDAARVSS